MLGKEDRDYMIRKIVYLCEEVLLYIIMISIRFEFHIYINKKSNDVLDKKFEENTVSSLKGEKRPLVIEEIEKWKGALSPSTISNYLTALRSLTQYLGNNVDIKSLNQETIKGYEKWLHNRQISLNTISCYMRSLRSIVNKIIGNDIKKDWFNTVFTGRTNTEKRSVPESDIVKIRDLKFKQSSFGSLVRDLFLFSFYALGMPFIDMAFLKKEQIKDDKLTYFRHKTGRNVTIKLEPCMKEILNRYVATNRDYVFPIIKSSNNEKAYAEYLIMLNRYNRTLKKIAQKAGVQNRLTSYTPRHTWASLAYNNCIDLHVISKGLGHANPQTTLTYIRQIDDSRLEEANHSIISRIALDRC